MLCMFHVLHTVREVKTRQGMDVQQLWNRMKKIVNNTHSSVTFAFLNVLASL